MTIRFNRATLVETLELRIFLSGNLDPTWGTGGFVQGPAADSSPQYSFPSALVDSDGRLLLSADVGANQNRIALFRFLPNGALDSSFGSNGSVMFGTGDQSTYLAQTAGGEIFVASYKSLYEINSNGVVNTAFGAGGSIVPPGVAATNIIFSILSDGNDVLVEDATGNVLRYQPDGTLDTTFGNAGVLAGSQVRSVVVTPTAKIDELFGSAIHQFNSNGSPDLSFGQSGEIAAANVFTIAPQFGPAGQLYLLQVANGTYDWYRITASGATDTAFTPIITSNNGLAVEPDGSSLSFPTGNGDFSVTHYNSSGTEDASSNEVSFGTSQLLPLGSGKYIIVGSATQILQMTAANVPDASFGVDGSLTALNAAEPPTTYTAVATQSDRKVIAGGIANGPSGQVLDLTRYNVDGSVDSSFGSDGATQVTFGSYQAMSVSLLIQSNGQIVAAGNLGNPSFANVAPTVFGVARFNSDGSVDTTFGTDGTVIFQNDANPTLLWQNGQVLIGTSKTLYRLNTNGSLDPTFPTSIPGGNAFAVQGDGKILVDVATSDPAGIEPTTTKIYRYNTDGSADTEFGSNGKVNSVAAMSGYNLSVDQLLAESNGTIVALLSQTSQFGVEGNSPYEMIGLNANGSVDLSFGVSGISNVQYRVESPAVPPNPWLAAESDGKLLFVTGQFSSVGSPLVVTTQRYSANGVLDTTYGTGGSSIEGAGASTGPGATVSLSDVNISNVAAIDSAGRLLLAGDSGSSGPNIFAVDTQGSATTGPATHLVFDVEPSILPDASLSVAVLVEDANNSLVSTDASIITLGLNGGTPGASLVGATMQAEDGVAIWPDGNAFPSLSGNDFTLTATDPGLAPATSAAFNVPAPLGFAVEPSNATTNASPGPVVVDVLNPDGTIDTTSDANVTLSLSNATAGATLDGNTFVAAVNGLATFTDLSLTTAGSGYTLSAKFNNSPVAAVLSTPFDIAAPSALAPTLSNVKLQAEFVIGSKFSARIPVVLTSGSASVMKGTAKISIFADSGTVLDGTRVPVASLSKRINLKAEGKTKFTIALQSLPPGLAAGTYHLLVEVTDPFGATNSTATTQTLQASAPFVQPTVAVGSVLPTTIAFGRYGYVWVTVTNQGNVQGRGIKLTLGLSTDGVTPVAGEVLTIARSGAAIPPKSSRRFRLRFKATSALSAGTYYPYLTVSLADVSATSAGTASFVLG